MTPSTLPLFHESFTEALRECVTACGGSKKVGALLWPERDVDAAGRHLSDCLNDAKRERLSPEQVVLILRMARAAGCHAGMLFLARELGYADPQPIEPEDERARLQRHFIDASRELSRLVERIQTLTPSQPRGGRR